MRSRTNSGHSLSRFSVPLLPKPQSPARRAGGFEERWSLSAGRRTGALPFRPQIPLYAIDYFFRQQRSLHTGANLRKRLFARRRSVVAAIDDLKAQGLPVDDNLLEHLSSHTGDGWTLNPIKSELRF
jgi:hypothetical protein